MSGAPQLRLSSSHIKKGLSQLLRPNFLMTPAAVNGGEAFIPELPGASNASWVSVGTCHLEAFPPPPASRCCCDGVKTDLYQEVFKPTGG